jgi:hypothetical protein
VHRWGLTSSADCDCGANQQTMRHISDDCPLRRFPSGLVELHDAGQEAVEYLTNLDLNL